MPAPQRRTTYAELQRSINQQKADLLMKGKKFKTFDQLRQRHFWSTAVFTPVNGYISGAQQLFITPPGQNGQGFPSGVALTEADTNWKSANRVPDNQNFEITEIGVRVAPVPASVDTDLGAVRTVPTGLAKNAFLQNCVVNIVYLTNAVPLGLACDFAEPAGPYHGTLKVPSADASEEEPRVGTNGFPAPGLRRRFKVPILLQHGETFSFEFRLPRAVYKGLGMIYATLDFWATESFTEKS